MTVVCACVWLSHFAVFSFSQLRGWVPLFFPFHPIMHAMLVLSLMTALLFLYLTTGEHLEHDSKWVRLPHDSLNDCDVCMCVVVTSCCIFFSHIDGESHCSFHFTQNVSNVGASSNDCLPSLYLTTGEHLEHDRWASRPAVDSLNDLRMCACGWLSHFTVFSFFQLRWWVPLFFSFHPIMRAMSVLSSNGCLAFSLSHLWGTLGTWQKVSKTT